GPGEPPRRGRQHSDAGRSGEGGAREPFRSQGAGPRQTRGVPEGKGRVRRRAGRSRSGRRTDQGAFQLPGRRRARFPALQASGTAAASRQQEAHASGDRESGRRMRSPLADRRKQGPGRRRRAVGLDRQGLGGASRFGEESLPRSYTGNDVIDLREPLRRERFAGAGRPRRADALWLARHLGARELKRFPKDGDGFRSFWRIFAAKEAAWKALVQAGVRVPDGAYRLLEFDAELNEIVCLPTGDRVRAEFAEDDSDKLHCVASLAAAPAVVRRGVARLAAGAD